MRALYEAIMRVDTADSTTLALNDATYAVLRARVAACDARAGMAAHSDTDAIIVWMLACMRDGMAFDMGTLMADPSVDGVAFFALSSGSTGVPKRIAVPEEVLVPCVEHWSRHVLCRDDRVLLVHARTFDPFVCDVLAALLCRARLLVPRCPPSDFTGLMAFVSATAPSVLHCTPSFLMRIPAFTRRQLLALVTRQLATGGEPPLPWATLCAGAPLEPPPRLLSFYGTTELSVWSCVLDIGAGCCPAHGLRHIGEPIRDTRVWLAEDDDNRICMSRGGVEVRTNDIGSRCALTGAIVFVGRVDRVRKRFGRAISLDELEHRVAGVSGVSRCRVELAGDGEDDIEIVCFAELLRDDVQRKLVKRAVRAVLPPQSRVLIVDSFAISEHGKVAPAPLLELLREKMDAKRGSLRGGSRRLLDAWLQRKLPTLDATTTLLDELDSIAIHIIACEFSLLSNVSRDVAVPLFLFTPVADIGAKCWSAILDARRHSISLPQDSGDPSSGALWTQRTGKCVDASIVVAGDRAVCCCHDGFAYCVDWRTGLLLWKSDVGDRMEMLASFTADGAFVWCGTRSGDVVMVALSDGHIAHSVKVAGTCKGIACLGTDGAVLVSSDCGLYTVHAARPAVVVLEGVFLCPATLCPGDAGAVAVSSTGRVALISAPSMTVQWSAELATKRPARQAFLSAPAVDAQSVWVASTGACFKLDAASGALLLECALPELGGCFRSPTLLGDGQRALVCGSRAIAMVNGAGVERILVCEPGITLTTRAVFMPAGDEFVVATECGRVLVYATAPLELLRSTRVGSFAIYATPTRLSDGTFILGTRGNAVMRRRV